MGVGVGWDGANRYLHDDGTAAGKIGERMQQTTNTTIVGNLVEDPELPCADTGIAARICGGVT